MCPNTNPSDCASEETKNVSSHPGRRLIKLFFVLLGWAMLVYAVCPPGRSATYYVTTRSAIFNPGELAISAGDTVTWTNNDNTEHTASSDDGIFESGTLEEEDSYSYTFTDEGVYTYYCQFHGHGMSGEVIVSEASENTQPDTPVNQLPLDHATNQPVAVQLNASVFSDPDALDFHGASQWLVFLADNNSLVSDSGAVTSGSLTNYSPDGLSDGTTYDWQVRYQDGRGLWSEYSTPTRFTTLISFAAVGVGLRASYNNVADFSAPLVIETNAGVNFNWGNVRPNRRITADNFAVRWEGSLLPKFTQTYQIQFEYAGQARVWVNNQLLIDDWTGCSFKQTRRGSIALVAGQLVAVRVEYVAAPTGASAVLRWTSPSLPMEVVPTARLFPQAP